MNSTLPARLARGLLLALMVVVAGMPLYWLLNTATGTNAELYSTGQSLLPHLERLPQVFDVFVQTPLLRWLRNSSIIAMGTTTLSLLIAIFAGYAISRFRFHGRGLLSFGLFTTQMLPEALVIVPMYAIFVTLGLINSMWGLILATTAFAMPVAVFIISTAMDKVPYEIEEAARVDGASRLRILSRIVLPLVVPSLAAASVITFFEGWNEYLFASTFLQSQEKWTTSVGLASFIGEFVTPLPTVFSAALIFALPAIVFFLLVQRRIVGGLTAGSVKG